MTQQTQLTKERSFDLLSKSRRRYLLELLREDGKQDIEVLAEGIAALERDVQREQVGDDATRRVHVSLVHNHIPQLADHDVVEYDRDTGAVVLMDVFDELEPFLDAATEDAPPAPQLFSCN